MTEYKIGDKFISRKPHPCGGNTWQITRLGADVKIKCETCGRALFVGYDDLKKTVKTYIKNEEDNDKNS